MSHTAGSAATRRIQAGPVKEPQLQQHAHPLNSEESVALTKLAATMLRSCKRYEIELVMAC